VLSPTVIASRRLNARMRVGAIELIVSEDVGVSTIQ
jgi:hypothetical protein